MIKETTVLSPPATPVTAKLSSTFFSAAEARVDQWRQFCAVARAWQSAATRGTSEDALFAEAIALFGNLAPLEAFFAFPGTRLMGAIEQALAERNVGVCARLAQHLSTALLTGTFRYDHAAWDPLQEDAATSAEILPPDLQGGNGHKPYFETLVVTPTDPSQLGARAARPEAAPPLRGRLHLRDRAGRDVRGRGHRHRSATTTCRRSSSATGSNTAHATTCRCCASSSPAPRRHRGEHRARSAGHRAGARGEALPPGARRLPADRPRRRKSWRAATRPRRCGASSTTSKS